MILDDDYNINDNFDLIDDNTGHRIRERAQMNTPEDELGDVDILVFGESPINNGIIEPHFHVCRDKKGDGCHYTIDIKVKIRHIETMTILQSNTGHNTWDSLSYIYNTVLDWLKRKAFDADITNKEAIRQEWNRCNMSNRVKKEEL